MWYLVSWLGINIIFVLAMVWAGYRRRKKQEKKIIDLDSFTYQENKKPWRQHRT